MSKFLTPLICEKVEGTKDQWQLHEPLIYQSDLAIQNKHYAEFSLEPLNFMYVLTACLMFWR